MPTRRSGTRSCAENSASAKDPIVPRPGLGLGAGSIDASFPSGRRKQLQNGFARMRDTRFLEAPSMPGFERRSSWMFPDDGCFARAALAGKNLSEWGFPRPWKLFAFGKLVAQTPNTLSGLVTWWYHIVPVVRVGSQVMALDPSVEPRWALPFETWVARMGGVPEDFKFSVCVPGSYAPYSSCMNPSSDEESSEFEDQYEFLDDEWGRIHDLRRDPRRELGDEPPWLPGH